MYKFIIAFLLSISTVTAQESAICKIKNPTGRTQGSAVMVHKVKELDGYYLGLAATAFHVVARRENEWLYPIDGPQFTVIHSDGSTVAGVSAAVNDYDNDISLIWLTCPNHIPIVKLHDNSNLGKINLGYEQDNKINVIFQGYGMGEFMTHRGPFSFRHKNDLYSDAIVTPGQSGGAMWIDGELAGIISHGIDDFDKPHGAVWPATCVNSELIPPMIRRALANPPK